LENYPSYRLEDVYRKSFKDGGLTILQIHALFEDTQKRKLKDWRFQCRIHGINPDGKQPSAPTSQGDTPLFGDPSEYEHLSEEQKQALTEKMMGKHKALTGGKLTAIGS
jgi:hypothetical protein